MNLLDTHGPFVKDQIHLQDQLADKYRHQEWRSTRHQQNAVQARLLLRDLEAAQAIINGCDSVVEKKTFVSSGLDLSPEDLDGLPDDVLAQLKLSETETIECAIIEIIQKAGGVLPVNKVIVGLYRKTGISHERAALISRLHRMVSKGRLHTNAQDRLGIFSTRPIEETESQQTENQIPAAENHLASPIIDGGVNSIDSSPPTLLRNRHSRRSSAARFLSSRP